MRARRRPLTDTAWQSGFSLLEALVAMTLTALIVGAMMSMLTTTQETDVGLSERSETARAGQLAISWIQRDLRRAGIGYADMIAPMPLIIPLEGGGIEVRHNPNGITRLIVEHLSRGGTQLKLAAAGDFEVGDQVALFDSSGSFQLLTVVRVMANGRILRVAEPASSDFRTDRGAAVATLETLRYFVDDAGDTPRLMRQVDEDTPVPVANDVSQLEFTYFDDGSPPAPFVPDSAAAQLRIRSVEARLWIDRAERRLGIGNTPTVRFTTHVVPRAISLLR